MKLNYMRHTVRICAAALTLAVCVFVSAQEPEPAAIAATDADTIVTGSGRRVRCTVQSIDEKGAVLFTSAWVRGEARADMKEIQRLLLKATDPRTGKDVVTITNGDSIDGEVLEITDEHVVIDSEIMDELDIPLRVVERIAFGVEGRYVGNAGFTDGDFKRWEATTGEWWYADDRQHRDGVDHRVVVAVPIDPDGGVSVAFKAVRSSPRNVSWYLDAYKRNKENASEQDCVRITFRRPGGRRGAYDPKMYGRPVFHPDGQGGPRAVEFRVAYDGKSRRASIWLDGKLTAWRIVRAADPEVSTHILLVLRGPGYIEQVRVIPHATYPEEKKPDAGEKTEHVLVMLNGGRTKCPQFTLEDEQYMLLVRGEEMPVPADRVKHIIMAKEGQTLPAVRKGDVRAVAGCSRVTLRLTDLKEDHLAGHCEYLGDVRIVRKALERIEATCRIEAVPAAPKPEAPETGE